MIRDLINGLAIDSSFGVASRREIDWALALKHRA
jgi:hypothetical protein